MDPFDASEFACCDQPLLVRRELDRRQVRWEGAQLCCTRCGAERPVRVVHLLWQMRHTACCLEMDGARRSTTLLVKWVTCNDCLLMLASELVEVPIPDWRPAQAMPEDYYAA